LGLTPPSPPGTAETRATCFLLPAFLTGNTGDSGPGFTALFGVVAIVAAALLAA